MSSYLTRHHFPISEFGARAKECPFCGSNRVMLYVNHGAHVSCMSCGADGPILRGDGAAQEAIELWNRRPTPSNKQEGEKS